MRVSHSSIQTFKRCRRLWEFQYKHGLFPIYQAPAIETGLSYHDKVEHLIKNGEVNQDGDAKTNAMALAFQKFIYPKLKEKFDPEVWFKHITPKGNTLVGRYDGIGETSLLEHKTTSGSITGAYWSSLELDEQIPIYMLASGKNKIVYTVCQKPTIRITKRESYEDFQKRCIAWYEEDTPFRIASQVVTRDLQEIKAFESEIDAMCEEMEGCKNFYRNPSFCWHWGRPCEYMPICKSYVPEMGLIPGFEIR